MNAFFTCEQKLGNTIFTFSQKAKVLSTSPLNGGLTRHLPIMSSPKVLILRAFSLNITSQNRAKGVRQSSYPVLNSHKRV